MAGVGLVPCVSYTECQELLCDILCLTLSVKDWPVFLYVLH